MALLLGGAAATTSVVDDAMALARESRAIAADGDFERALTLAQAARNALANTPRQDVVAYLEDDSAVYLLELRRFDQALEIAQQAQQRIAALMGTDSPAYGLLTSTLGAVLVARGDIAKGASELRQAYAALEQGDPDRRARVAVSLARTSRLASEPQQAVAWAERAIELAVDRDIRRRARIEQIEALLSLRRLQEARTALGILAGEGSSQTQLDRLHAALAFEIGELATAESVLVDLLDRSDVGADERLQIANRLGHLYVVVGRLVEAQQVYRSVLDEAIAMQYSAAHPLVGRTLHSLAITYKGLGQYEEAAVLYERALNVLTSSLGADSEAVGRTRLEFSRLLALQEDPSQAAAQAREAVDILEPLDRPEPLGLAHAALGLALVDDGRGGEGLGHIESALPLLEVSFGPMSPYLAPGLIATAELVAATDFQRAKRSINRAIDILERSQSTTFSGLATAYAAKSELYAEREPRLAMAMADQSLAVVGERLERTSDQRYLQEVNQSRHVFETYLNTLSSAYESEGVGARMLIAAQYPKLSLVAESMSQAAERASAHSGELVRLLAARQRQTRRLAELDVLNERMLAGLVAPNEAVERERAELRGTLRETRLQIAREYPQFAEAAFPRPVDLGVLQARIGREEAVFTMLSSDTGTHLFLVTKESLYVESVPVVEETLRALARDVRRSVSLDDDAPPVAFAHEAAHELYGHLIGPFAEQLEYIDHLVYVPDRAVASVPFGLLTTSPSIVADDDYRNVDFLQNEIALSTVPSLSALVALRLVAEAPAAPSAMLGIGHPLLGEQASAMRPDDRVDTLDVNIHRQLRPLASSMLEINDIASRFERSKVLFQRDASEAALYALDGLEQYGVIVFATHGLLRDDTIGVPEPALVLSQDPGHNGLLMTSEIADLSLNADWVVLSACNTAGPDGSPRASGLSGLAKSFFYAGARGLLVSHWSVNSTAAVWITTSTFDAYTADPSGGKAGALQAALRRFTSGVYGPQASHPAFWAPFVFVGDGAS